MTPDEVGRSLYKSIDAFFAFGPEDKSYAIKAVLDEMIGDEERALIKQIPGVPDSLVEAGSDTLINILHAAILNRLLRPPAPPAPPA